MRRTLLLIAVAAVLVPVIAVADESLVRFKGGIGVIPVSSGVGAAATAEVVNRNIVRGVQPAGQIWRIEDLKANVKLDGRITVHGEGLLLAGGNNIGTNAGASVFATLFCGTVAHSSESVVGVALEDNGDFRIDDVLTPVPPDPCVSPVLLIRNANGGAWFAAGIPKD